MNNALVAWMPSPAELSNLRRLRLRSIAREPWMKQFANDIAALILDYPDETLRVAGLAGVIALCAYFGREPRKRRV